jgi:alpha-glucosidase
MLGGDCMIAPVYEQNADGRYVWLPEDMLMIRFRSARDYDLVPMRKGDHRISLSLGEFPLFVKNNHAVLLCPGGESSELLDDTVFTVLGHIEKEGVYELYRDDGISPDPDLVSHITPVPLALQESSSSLNI